jgi:hypothetical protein
LLKSIADTIPMAVGLVVQKRSAWRAGICRVSIQFNEIQDVGHLVEPGVFSIGGFRDHTHYSLTKTDTSEPLGNVMGTGLKVGMPSRE